MPRVEACPVSMCCRSACFTSLEVPLLKLERVPDCYDVAFNPGQPVSTKAALALIAGNMACSIMQKPGDTILCQIRPIGVEFAR